MSRHRQDSSVSEIAVAKNRILKQEEMRLKLDLWVDKRLKPIVFHTHFRSERVSRHTSSADASRYTFDNDVNANAAAAAAVHILLPCA